MKSDKDSYMNWWPLVKDFSQSLQLETIDQYYDLAIDYADELSVMQWLFDRAWTSILEPLFNGKTVDRIDEDKRRVLAVQRLMIGNLLLLVKMQCPEIESFVKKVETVTSADIYFLQKEYQDIVFRLYKDGKISCNEYHNSKNIYLMIRPNILKKTDGASLYP